MTLNLNFTLNFHYYEHPFENLFYILTLELVYITSNGDVRVTKYNTCGRRGRLRLRQRLDWIDTLC